MVNIFNFKSWRKVVVGLLAIILFCSTISLFTTVYSYQKQINQTQMNENNSICSKWVSNTDTRLNLIHEQVYDVFVTLYDDTEFQKNPNEIDTFTGKKIVDLLQKKIIASDDISAIFLYDVNSGYYTYNASSKSTIVKLPMVKSYLKEICVEESAPVGDHSWEIKYIGGNKYFYQCMRMGRFIIGTVSDCDLYKFNDKISDSDVTAIFTDGEEKILSIGDEKLVDSIEPSSEGTKYEDGFVTSTLVGEYSNIIGILTVKYNRSYFNLLTGTLFLSNAILEIVLIVLLFSYFRRRIMKQTNDLIVATQEVSKGNFDYRIDTENVGSDEFKELYTNFNNMTSQITDLKIEQYDMRLKEEENKLRMLRGQLRPHTFMNGITTISNLTYDNDPEKVRDYIYQFSQFTRYMLNTSSEWTSIKEELKQIENYIEMQKIKFPNSIDYTCDVDQDIVETKIPYLLLFSQVENSFKHAMSLIQTLHIYIKCEKYEEEGFKGIRLIEEDDGDGFPQEAIDNLNANDKMFTKEHIGLTNTKYTLHLLYKRDDLLRISNSEKGGARIELLIPDTGDNDETINM
ncbi:MAG: histidine kinase [Erysipelotrichaceae bacterium]|nr:histidine kinase [Erysipelotrichaceae bacterium]